MATVNKNFKVKNGIEANDASTIVVNSSSDALRITQTGAGNALVVEDSANPDSTPFVVNPTGYVGIGTTSPEYPIHTVGVVDPTGMIMDAIGIVAPNVLGRRARGSLGSETAIQANDNMLSITGMGYVDSDYEFSATIQLRAAEDWVTGSQGSYIIFRTTEIGTSSQLERLRIDNNGNVGIGRTEPAEKLDVFGNILLSKGIPEIQFNDGGPRIGNSSGTVNTFSIHTGGATGSSSSERFRITNVGYVGINTINPTERLEVSGNIKADSFIGQSFFADDISASTSVTTSAGNIDQPIYFSAAGSVLDNLPARVHPAEQLLKQAVWWIDAAHSSAGDQTITNLGWGGSALDAQCGSTTGADSNDPKYLDWQGENYVYLPGVAGNYLSVPDEAALDITGDIDIRVKVALDDWTPGATQTLAAKWLSATNKTYRFDVNTDGRLRFWWSSDGSAANGPYYSTVAPTVTDGAALWVRVTFDVDNGASGNDIAYWTSSDGTTWTQLGTTVTTAGTAALYDGTAAVNVGARENGANDLLAAKFYRAQVLSGISGTPVLDVDCSQITSGADTSFTALTGQTVTINRSTSGRKTVGVVHPRWLFGTDDYMEVADNDLIDFGASDSFTVLLSGRYFGNSSTNSNPLTKQVTGGAGYALRFSSTDTTWYSLLTDTDALTGNRGALGVLGDTFTFASTVERSTGLRHTDLNGSRYTDNAASMTSFENNVPLRIGSRSDQVKYNSPMEFTAAAIWRRALTAGEISLLNAYFQGREG